MVVIGLQSDFNNRFTVMYGVCFNVPTNTQVNVTTPIPMQNYAHIFCCPVWGGAYWNHGAINWINETTIAIINYRSVGKATPAVTFYWCIFC